MINTHVYMYTPFLSVYTHMCMPVIIFIAQPSCYSFAFMPIVISYRLKALGVLFAVEF